MYGQSSVNSGGSTVTNATGSISYSIGKTFYRVLENASGTVTPGVQHIYKIETTQTTPKWEQAKIDIFFAFPNPTQDLLTLRFMGEILQGYVGTLFDINGRKIVEQSLSNQETIIDLSNLKPGVYILRVVQQDETISVVRVVKIQ